MKPCTRCGVYKRLDEFHRNRARRDGRQTICAECTCRQKRAQYAADPEKFLTRNAEWRAANPETVADGRERYESENHDARLRRANERRAANPEPFRDRNRRDYERHAEARRAYAREYRKRKREGGA